MLCSGSGPSVVFPRGPLLRGLDPGAGAAHRHLHGDGLQVVLPAVDAELPPQEHAALQHRDRVVVQTLPGRVLALDQDAACTQALGLSVGGGEVVLHGFDPAEQQGGGAGGQQLITTTTTTTTTSNLQTVIMSFREKTNTIRDKQIRCRFKSRI